MTNEELTKILENHKHWLNEDCEGWKSMKAYLRGADLRGADLRGADLTVAKGCYTYCPSEGAFIGWKKAETDGGNTVIVKLRIPEDAKRSSATTEKCRADKAEVLEIQDMDGNVLTDVNVHSSRSRNFKYVVGEIVYPEEPFCEDRWEECTSGIHFFIDRRAAVEY